jgi:tRNA-splicing endonuclease subunit Sen54
VRFLDGNDQLTCSNNISHALLTPDNPFPHVVVSRGNVQASMGHTVRSKKAGKMVSRSELLPEEALYLTERGSLQLWYGPDDGEWSDEIYGINGAVEMSVMQAYATFIGKEGLTLERYQVG